MTTPLITITSITKTKISDEPGYDQAIVKFTANQHLDDFIVRAGGAGNTNGVVVGQSDIIFPSETVYPSETLYPALILNIYPSETLYPSDGCVLLAGTEQQFEVDNEELGVDGTYRINIYGMNELGEWTAYG